MAHAKKMLSETLAQYGDKVRVEMGYPPKVAVATKELLGNDKTAEHYVEGAFDARGNKIKVGEKMTFIDYKGVPVWFVYHWEAAPAELCAERGWPEGHEYWAEVAQFDTFEEAEAHAVKLAG